MRELYACLFNSKRIGMYSLFLLISFNAFAFSPYELADDTETVSNLVCSTAPIISCPSDYFGCPGDATTTAALGSATAVPGDADWGDLG